MKLPIYSVAVALIPSLLALAGCGGSDGKSELISIEVSGGLTGKQHTVVVLKDGRASCADQGSKRLSERRLKEAESLAKGIGPLAKESTPYGEPYPDARQYKAVVGGGTVEWFEGPDLPKVLDRAMRFADGTSALIC